MSSVYVWTTITFLFGFCVFSCILNHIGVIPLTFLLCVNSSNSFFSFSFCLLCFSCLFGHTVSIARRTLAPVDNGVLSRLLTPTQASLARSKSAAALSAEGGDAQGNTREKGKPSSYRNPLILCRYKALCRGAWLACYIGHAGITCIKFYTHRNKFDNVKFTGLAVFSRDAQKCSIIELFLPKCHFIFHDRFRSKWKINWTIWQKLLC